MRRPHSEGAGRPGAITPDTVLVKRGAGGVKAVRFTPEPGARAGAWAAPEQTVTRAASPAADIYAAGRLAQYLLTGQDPAGVSALDAVLDRATAHDPSARYASAGEMLADLAAVAAQAGPAVVVDPPETRPVRDRRPGARERLAEVAARAWGVKAGHEWLALAGVGGVVLFVVAVAGLPIGRGSPVQTEPLPPAVAAVAEPSAPADETEPGRGAVENPPAPAEKPEPEPAAPAGEIEPEPQPEPKPEIAPPPVPPAALRNRVANGGFEAGADGWRIVAGPDTWGRVRDDELSRSGAALKFFGAAAGSNGMAVQSVAVSGTRHRFSAWVWAEAGVAVEVHFYDTRGTRVAQHTPVGLRGTAGEWRQFAGEIHTPPATRAEIVLRAHGAGTVYWDDVRLES